MSGAPGPWRVLRTWFSQGGGGARSLFFNRLWIVAALAVGLIGVVIEDRGIALLGILVTLAAGVGWAWNRATLARLRYSRSVDRDRLFPGDQAVLRIEIVNDKPLPAPWITIDEEISDGLTLIGRQSIPAGLTGRRIFQLKTRLGPYERVVWRIPFETPERGVHAIGPALIRTGDPLGFFTNRLELRDETPLLVYPRITALPPFGLPPRHAVGNVRAPHQLIADPLRIVGIRDYRPEDPFKSIHWKASARQGGLQVRVLEPTTTLQLAIFANIDTFEHYWEGLDIAAAEQVIELTASLASWAISNRYEVSVTSNGIVAGADQTLRTPSGRGPEQRLRILEGLARLSPFSSSPFLRSLQAAGGRVSPGSTVVIITSLLPEGMTARMHGMMASGRRVVLVPVGSCLVPALQGLIVRRLAADPELEPPLERTGND